ncbi:hypothetical protein GIB67_028679 [Kingdonia uniflora]|uniref:Uncharacterized protein n=1 Tax=Kingdonia uniflora TaxID=39325 RepID=A0A7J7MTL8_9MAGN|nr:hypothetical protein GIB67_028679 [Kingdonia uniflora]
MKRINASNASNFMKINKEKNCVPVSSSFSIFSHTLFVENRNSSSFLNCINSSSLFQL